jgi:hypothetical protein
MTINPLTSIIDGISNIAGAIKARWELMTDKWYQARIDKAEAIKAVKVMEKQIQADQHAVESGDINALAKRIKEHGRLLLVAVMLGCSGCGAFRRDVVVVAEADVPVAMAHNGQDGYWVSKPVLMMYMEIADRYEAAKKAGKL